MGIRKTFMRIPYIEALEQELQLPLGDLEGLLLILRPGEGILL
jgi:hypothetical protein